MKNAIYFQNIKSSALNHFVVVLTLLAYISLTMGCKSNQYTEDIMEEDPTESNVIELTEEQYNNADIAFATLEKKKINHTIHLNGIVKVMPQNTITISTPMSGFVRQINWTPGMKVSKGQLMAQLEDKEYIQLQQDYLAAKNALKFAKLDFDRQFELAKNQAVSEKVLEQADEKVKQNEILVKSLEEKLKLINIDPSSLSENNLSSRIQVIAPLPGIITEVMANTGQYAHTGDELIKMINISSAKLVLKAFDKDMPYLSAGQPLIAYSNSRPDKKIKGRISYIVPKIGNEGFAEIICTLDDQQATLLPGMYVIAEIEAESMEAWTVPQKSTVTYGGKEYIFVQSDKNRFEMIEIKTGLKENSSVQVINHSEIEGKKIVSNGAYTLLMKLKNVEE